MEQRELAATLNLMLDDVTAIVHNQQVLAGIHAELDRNLFTPFEQDFIYKEQFGQFPSEPQKIIVNGVIITSRVLHQTGTRLSDIQGADLLYEIENEKFGLIQYKRPTNGNVKNDPAQLNTLLHNCPEICPNRKKRPIPVSWLPLKAITYCGCWYAVVDKKEVLHVPACEAESIFQGQLSGSVNLFEAGVSRNAFLELFSSCRIGALLTHPKDSKIKDYYVGQVLEHRHFVLEVRQLGKWLKR